MIIVCFGVCVLLACACYVVVLIVVVSFVCGGFGCGCGLLVVSIGCLNGELCVGFV